MKVLKTEQEVFQPITIEIETAEELIALFSGIATLSTAKLEEFLNKKCMIETLKHYNSTPSDINNATEKLYDLFSEEIIEKYQGIGF